MFSQVCEPSSSLVTFDSCRDNLKLDDFVVSQRLSCINADDDFHLALGVSSIDLMTPSS